MTRKLAIIAFCFCACFGLVGITYADTYASTTKENTAEQEQEINLDQYLNNGDKSLYDVIYGVSGNTVSNKLLKGRPSKPNANRGYFWVTYEGEKFAAHFDNDYFILCGDFNLTLNPSLDTFKVALYTHSLFQFSIADHKTYTYQILK